MTNHNSDYTGLTNRPPTWPLLTLHAACCASCGEDMSQGVVFCTQALVLGEQVLLVLYGKYNCVESSVRK